MQRARRDGRLAGFADAEVDDDLVEWGYGDYEGRTSAEIREDGARAGRSGPTRHPAARRPAQVTERLDRVVERLARRRRARRWCSVTATRCGP